MTQSIHAQILDVIATRFVTVPGATTTSIDSSRIFSSSDGVSVRVQQGDTTTEPNPQDTCRLKHTVQIFISVILPRQQQTGQNQPLASWTQLDPFKTWIHGQMMGNPTQRLVNGLALDTTKGQDLLIEDDPQALQAVFGYTVTYRTLEGDLTQ